MYVLHHTMEWKQILCFPINEQATNILQSELIVSKQTCTSFLVFVKKFILKDTTFFQPEHAFLWNCLFSTPLQVNIFST